MKNPLFAAVFAVLFFAAPAMAQHDHDHAGQGHEGHDHGAPQGGHVHREPPKDALFGYDLTGYTAAQAKAVVAEAQKTPCGCGRPGTTVASCLINDRACLFAPRQANAIIERATGAPYPAVKLDYSLTDGDVAGVALKSLTAPQAKKLMGRLEKMECTCGCHMKLLACLRDDPLCHASPAILARVYKEIVGKALPGAAPLPMPSESLRVYDALPGHDLSMLSAEKKALVLRYANHRACPCGCGMTLAQCRNEDPTCETSPKLVNSLIFGVISGEVKE